MGASVAQHRVHRGPNAYALTSGGNRSKYLRASSSIGGGNGSGSSPAKPGATERQCTGQQDLGDQPGPERAVRVAVGARDHTGAP